MQPIPKAAIDLILESEGVDQPWKWPGGGSGITLGFGCDIGADPESLAFWAPILSDTDIALLSQAKGKTGRAAAEIQSRFRGINIHRVEALAVFTDHTLPTEIARTLKTFPGVELMPPAVLGAMVSLVFNRGTDLTGDRRREMRIIAAGLAEFATFTASIRAQAQNDYIRKIAKQFRAMKRLWEGKGLDGLLTRRDAEADLILTALA